MEEIDRHHKFLTIIKSGGYPVTCGRSLSDTQIVDIVRAVLNNGKDANMNTDYIMTSIIPRRTCKT